MAWHSARDRLDEPRACCFDGSGAGEGCPLVGRRPWCGNSAPRPQRRCISPTRAAKPAGATCKDGEVAEWLKAHAWKVCLRETVTRVRIPLSPPVSSKSLKSLRGHQRPRERARLIKRGRASQRPSSVAGRVGSTAVLSPAAEAGLVQTIRSVYSPRIPCVRSAKRYTRTSNGAHSAMARWRS